MNLNKLKIEFLRECRKVADVQPSKLFAKFFYDLDIKIEKENNCAS